MSLISCRIGALPLLVSCSFAATFNVKDFGAAGDGRKKDTAAIAHAIETCAKAGGGVVSLPPGKYLTGALRLQSNVTFEVEAGATLLGSPDPEDYPLYESVWGDRKEYSSLLYADGAEHVTIRGQGAIDGQGQFWWRRMGWPDRRKIAPEQRTAAERAELAKVANGRDVVSAFTITTFYSGTDKPGDVFPVGVGTPRFRDFHFSNITARGSKSAGQITGLKELPVENITFSGVQIQAQTGLKITNAKDVVFQDVVIETAQGEAVSLVDSVGVDVARLRQVRK